MRLACSASTSMANLSSKGTSFIFGSFCWFLNISDMVVMRISTSLSIVVLTLIFRLRSSWLRE